MKWQIPAKTFLLGEYAALAGAPALLLTTTPCFELSLSDTPSLEGIHKDSPAGRWWQACAFKDKGLVWHDPYQGRGGFGASSAQFLGAYWASLYLRQEPIHQQAMLTAYLQHAQTGKGIPPSGYDVLAQSMHGCVYVDRQASYYQSFHWPFEDITFIVAYTGQKLATHQHLQTLNLPQQVDVLSSIVKAGKLAFESANSEPLVNAVNAYHQALCQLSLVAPHSLKMIADLKTDSDILAIKGCGAMGSDMLLLLVSTYKQQTIWERLIAQGLAPMATQADLYCQKSKSAK